MDGDVDGATSSLTVMRVSKDVHRQSLTGRGHHREAHLVHVREYGNEKSEWNGCSHVTNVQRRRRREEGRRRRPGGQGSTSTSQRLAAMLP